MSGKKEKLLVSLNGGGPWGFRLQGGAGTQLPLVVSKVRRKSKAYRRLFEADLILSVNDQCCKNLTYDQVMEIADKSGNDLTLEVMRQESNKENQVPSFVPAAAAESTVRTASPLKTVENGNILKETVSISETNSKTINEKEGIRIKSATLLSDTSSPQTNNSFENFTSHKLIEDSLEKKAESEKQNVEPPFPPFSELLQNVQGPPKPPRSPIDSSLTSRKEEINKDGDTIVKTKTETMHEVKGNTEVSFVKKEQESVSKSVKEIEDTSNLCLNSMDLNDLINATQKRLDSLQSGIKTKSPTPEPLSNLYEIKKTEMTSSTSVSETKKKEIFNCLNQTASDNSLLDINSSSKPKIEDAATDFTSFSQSLPKATVLDSSPFSQVPLATGFSSFGMAPSTNFSSTLPLFKPLQDISSYREVTRTSTILDSSTQNSMNSGLNIDALSGGLGCTSDESSLVTTETPFGTSTISKKKKMFSSSSFYEEPGDLYPTLEEQVEMARKIADSLADDTNKKSKGANMFYKRLRRSSNWIHEGGEPSDESAPSTPDVQGVEPPTPDISQVPFRLSKGPPTLKLFLDSRHPLDVNALRSSGLAISEHNVVSPEMCHGIVKDLHSPVGKGAALFAKRKKKSEEWVVDEQKVKAMLEENERKAFTMPHQTTSYNQYSTISRQDVKLVKSPWEAAMESPFGLCDAAFARVHPDQLADTVIRAADEKRRNSNTPTHSRQSSRLEGCMSPPPLTPAAAQYDIYHAKAPKGWQGSGITVEPPSLFPATTVPATQNYAPQGTTNVQNGFQGLRKMNFQNFNTVPRSWKSSGAR